MSKAGKILLLFGSLFWVGLFVFRTVYGGWHDSMWGPLALGSLMIVGGVAKDFRAILGFFTLKTTKHGMNMGVLILMALVGLACVNVFAVRYEKKLDLTSEGLNSLSEQAAKVAKSLKTDTEIVLLFRNDQQQSGEQITKAIGDLIDLFKNESNKIKFVAYNALQRPDLAQKYNYTSGPFALYALQGENRIRIDQPTENGVTKTLMKFGRDKKKVLYVIRGHGERLLEGEDEDGLSMWKSELEVTYDVKSIALFESSNKVPDDADAVAVIRPLQQFLEPELAALRDYAKRGGRLFLALDPGSKQNLALLTKSFGVEYENQFVLDLRSQEIGQGPATVLGVSFSPDSDITRSIPAGTFAIFHVASPLKVAPGESGVLAEALVLTDSRTMSIPTMDRTQQVEFKPNGPHILATVSKGKLAGSEKEFSAIVFGDSDFISNRILDQNSNKDLAMNSIAYLMEDRDLISIRPKEIKGTVLEMTTQGFAIYVLAFILPLPLLMFATGGFFWWRRRTA